MVSCLGGEYKWREYPLLLSEGWAGVSQRWGSAWLVAKVACLGSSKAFVVLAILYALVFRGEFSYWWEGY